jgi:hypothetical protein
MLMATLGKLFWALGMCMSDRQRLLKDGSGWQTE